MNKYEIFFRLFNMENMKRTRKRKKSIIIMFWKEGQHR